MSTAIIGSIFLLLGTINVWASNCQFANERHWEVSNDTWRVAEVLSTCEIKKNLWVKKDTSVVWFSNGQIQRINEVGKDSEAAPGIVVEKGAYLSWYSDGQIAYAQLLKNNTEVAPGIVARKLGSYVMWHKSGIVKAVEILMNDLPGAKKCQTAWFREDGSLGWAENSYMWPVCD